MSEGKTVSLNQKKDLPPAQVETPHANLLYSAMRAQEAVRGKLNNEDYLTFRHDADRLVLVVCDGVGQSFFGEIAARFLGEHLLDWLWDLPSDANINADKLSERLFNELHAWTRPASEQVKTHDISQKTNDLVRKALERKRKNGSAAVFACARLDFADDDAACVAFWLGNVRLRLWDGTGQEQLLAEGRPSDEQWNSARGPLHTNHLYHLALPSLKRAKVRQLALHSDGLHAQADRLNKLTVESLGKILEELAEDPASDDVALIYATLK